MYGVRHLGVFDVYVVIVSFGAQCTHAAERWGRWFSEIEWQPMGPGYPFIIMILSFFILAES